MALTGKCTEFADGDAGWLQYANFVDTLTAYLAKSEATANLVSTIEHRLNSCPRTGADFAAILAELNGDSTVRQVMATFAEETFPIALIQKDFAKDNQAAMELMRQGEEQFAAGQTESAIFHFSQALLQAEESDGDRALGSLAASLYDRRSAAFFKSQQYYECILDLEELLHIAGGDLSSSAVLRLASATVKLTDCSNLQRLQSIATVCEKMHKTERLPENLQAKLQTHIDAIRAMITALLQQPGGSKAETDVDAELKVLDARLTDPHPEIRGASAKVEVAFDPAKGRHIIAKQSIASGDVLFAEAPFAAFTLSELHCGNCFRRLANVKPKGTAEETAEDALSVDYFSFVPCTTCNKFIFCDAKCRSAASDRFHRAECQGKLFALESHLGIAYIALRTVLTAGGPSAALAAFHSMVPSTKGDYQAVLGQLPQPSRHDVRSSVAHVFTALFLAHTLSPFGVHCTDEETASLLPLLLHHLQQLSTNLVTIFEQEIVGGNSGSSASALPMPASNELDIGAAFYPTIALLNHSCDPDLVPLYFGSKLVLKATRAIAPGSEVSISYGPTYLKMSRLKRQKALAEQYFFTCQCVACQQRRENYHDAYLCPTCNGPAFLEANTSLVCSRNDGHICTDSVADILASIEQARGHLDAGASFLEQFKQRADSADVIAALVSTHKADVSCSEHLFPLNSLLVKAKNQMINCYLQMGHHDRAEAYTRQLVRVFTKYLSAELRMPLLQEQLRLVKILFLRVDELEEEGDPNDSGTSIADLCPLIEAALADFEASLQYYRAVDERQFSQMFAKECQFAEEKRAALRQLQQRL